MVQWLRPPVPRALALLALVLTCAARSAVGQTVFHVDPAAPVGGNGLSWATAFRGIRGAVNATAGNPQVTQIWVKAGTYQPGSTPFDLRNGVTLYGGFVGNETSLAQRNPDLNTTTLDGQGLYRILNTAPTDGTAVVDGFTIRDGSSSQSGGACTGGNPVFRRCRFISNHSGADGGVWYGYGGSIVIVDCRFIDNDASARGACLSTYEGTITAINSRFIENAAGDEGVIRSYEGPISLVNCVVAGNTGPDGGGVTTYNGPVSLVGCTLGNNQGVGAVSFAGPAKLLRNCVVWGNEVGGPSDFAYCSLPGEADGPGNVVGDPLFANPASRDYRLGDGVAAIDAASLDFLPADAYDLDRDGDVAEPLPVDQNGGPRVRGAGLDMGALEHYPDCNANFVEDSVDIANGTSPDADSNGVPDECEDCNGNSVPDSLDIAGGVSEDCQRDGVPDECQQEIEVVKYKIDDGSAENTIGLSNPAELAWLNRLEVIEGGEIVRQVRVAWGSGVPNGYLATVCIWVDPDQDGNPGNARLRSSELVAVTGSGSGQLQLIDVADTYIGVEGTSFYVGVAVAGTAALAPIDQGAPSSRRSWIAASTTSTALDLENLGSSSLFGLVDSFGLPGDWLVRADGWREIDCNGNGELDECDVFAGTSVDCQGDGIPDECQLTANDCNGNGVPDDCDIASGVDGDCQPNGIPDACEISAGDEADIDGNGVPDVCEDCDGNGIPDSLDLKAGAADCQGDGILDVCQLGEGDLSQYLRDDGTAEVYVSSDAPNMAWLASYEVAEGAERIVSIEIQHARMPVGFPVDVYLWSDPNQDGDPTDARVLAHVSTTIEAPDSGTFESVAIPGVFVGEAGTKFFVGAIVHDFVLFSDYPGAKSNLGPTYTSWLVGKFGTIDPNDLSAGNDEFLRIDDLGGPFVGTWCIRATGEGSNDCNENGIPDDCDIADGTSSDADKDGRPDECSASACPADLDGDGAVGAQDLAALLAGWGGSGGADLDGDGVVGAQDLAAMLASWGACP